MDELPASHRAIGANRLNHTCIRCSRLELAAALRVRGRTQGGDVSISYLPKERPPARSQRLKKAQNTPRIHSRDSLRSLPPYRRPGAGKPRGPAGLESNIDGRVEE